MSRRSPPGGDEDERGGTGEPPARARQTIVADVGGAAGAVTPAPDPSGAGTVANGLSAGIAQLLPQVYTVVISVLAARTLGAEGMGQQSFIAFVSVSLVLVATGGLPLAMSRYVGESVGRGRPGAVHDLLAWALRLELIGAAFGAGVLIATSFFRVELRVAWLFAAATCFVGVLQTIPANVLNGLQRWRQSTMVGVVTGFVGVGATIAVLAAGLGIAGMFAVEAVVALVNLLFTARLARRALAEVAPRRERDPALRREVLRYAGGASIQVLLTFLVFRRSEFFFLDAFSDDTQIALYSVSYAAVTALARFPEAMGMVVFNSVATLTGAGDLARVGAGFARVLRLLLLLTLPITALAMAIGPEAVRVVFGEDFAGAAPVLLLLLVTLPMLALLVAANAVVTGMGALRVVLVWGGVAAVVNLALGFLLVPGLGAVGAAVANGVGQLIAGVPVLLEALRLLGGIEWSWSGPLRALAGALVGAAVAAAVVTAMGGGAGVVLGTVAGVSALGLASSRLGVLRSDDADWLADALGPRVGGVVARVGRPFVRRASLTDGGSGTTEGR